MARRTVLVALNEHSLALPGLIPGIGRYAMLHPHIAFHMHLFEGDPGPSRHLLQRIVQHLRPDGLLLDVLWSAGRLRFPAGLIRVNVADYLPPAGLTVVNDQAAAGRMAAEHLLGQGLPHYAFAGIVMGGHGARLRWRGFRARLREAGHEVLLLDEEMRPGCGNVTDEAIAAWIARLPRPIGIHTHTIGLAVRTAWACRGLGLRVPADVALIGGQDNPALADVWGSISAIEFGRERVAYEGLRMIEKLLGGASPPRQPILVPPVRIVPRSSSDARGARDPEIGRIRQWVRENAHRSLGVKELLEQTSLSRRTLERRFAVLVGHGLHDEIVGAHIERAQALLRGTTIPLRQVARQSGYNNYVTFAIAFRQATGMTASSYRLSLAPETV